MSRYRNGKRIKRKNKKEQSALLHCNLPSSHSKGAVQIGWSSTKIAVPVTSGAKLSNGTVSPISIDSSPFIRAMIGSCLSIRQFDRGTLWRWNLTRSSPQQVLSMLSEDQSDIDRYTPIIELGLMPRLFELDVVEFPSVPPSASDYLIKWMACDRSGDKGLFAFIGTHTASKILECAENAKDGDELIHLSRCLQGSLILGAVLTTSVDQMLISMQYSLWTFLQVAHTMTHDTGFEKKLLWKLLNGLTLEGHGTSVGIAQLVQFLDLTLPGRMKREHKEQLLASLVGIVESRTKNSRKKEKKRDAIVEIEESSGDEMERVEEEEITRVTREMVDKVVWTKKIKGMKEKIEDIEEEVDAVVTSILNDVVRREAEGEKVKRCSIATEARRPLNMMMFEPVESVHKLPTLARRSTNLNTEKKEKKAERIPDEKMQLRSATKKMNEEKEKRRLKRIEKKKKARELAILEAWRLAYVEARRPRPPRPPPSPPSPPSIVDITGMVIPPFKRNLSTFERVKERNLNKSRKRKLLFESAHSETNSETQVGDVSQPERKRGRPSKESSQKIMQLAQRMRKNLLEEWDKEMENGGMKGEKGGKRDEEEAEMGSVEGGRRQREKRPVKLYDPTPKTPKKRTSTIVKREKICGNIPLGVDEPEVIQIESSNEEDREYKREKKRVLNDPDYKGYAKIVKKGEARVEEWVNHIDLAGVDPVGEDFPLPPQLVEAAGPRTIAKKIPLWDGLPFQMPALISKDGVIDVVERTEGAVEGMIQDERRMEELEYEGEIEETIEQVCALTCLPMHAKGGFTHDHTYARTEEEGNEEFIDVVTVEEENGMDMNEEKEGEEGEEEEKSNEMRVAVDGFEMDDDVEEIHEIIEEGGEVEKNVNE